jgi:hypothetical protein
MRFITSISVHWCINIGKKPIIDRIFRLKTASSLVGRMKDGCIEGTQDRKEKRPDLQGQRKCVEIVEKRPAICLAQNWTLAGFATVPDRPR